MCELCPAADGARKNALGRFQRSSNCHDASRRRLIALTRLVSWSAERETAAKVHNDNGPSKEASVSSVRLDLHSFALSALVKSLFIHNPYQYNGKERIRIRSPPREAASPSQCAVLPAPHPNHICPPLLPPSSSLAISTLPASSLFSASSGLLSSEQSWMSGRRDTQRCARGGHLVRERARLSTGF